MNQQQMVWATFSENVFFLFEAQFFLRLKPKLFQ